MVVAHSDIKRYLIYKVVSDISASDISRVTVIGNHAGLRAYMRSAVQHSTREGLHFTLIAAWDEVRGLLVMLSPTTGLGKLPVASECTVFSGLLGTQLRTNKSKTLDLAEFGGKFCRPY
jgi:hypothetical protein